MKPTSNSSKETVLICVGLFWHTEDETHLFFGEFLRKISKETSLLISKETLDMPKKRPTHMRDQHMWETTHMSEKRNDQNDQHVENIHIKRRKKYVYKKIYIRKTRAVCSLSVEGFLKKKKDLKRDVQRHVKYSKRDVHI